MARHRPAAVNRHTDANAGAPDCGKQGLEMAVRLLNARGGSRGLHYKHVVELEGDLLDGQGGGRNVHVNRQVVSSIRMAGMFVSRRSGGRH